MLTTERTLKKLRNEGWEADVVERWIPGANVRKDFLGGIDIIACRFSGSLVDDDGIMGVQCTVAGEMSKRVKKLLAEPRMLCWVSSGGRLEVWGWKKEGRRWKCIVQALRIVDGVLVADPRPRKKRERRLFR